MDKISSGIEGFDKLIFGGFPKGRAYLVSGEPGTGKSIFCMQFLLDGLKKGEKGIFVTIDEKPEHLILDAIELGWDIRDYLSSGQLQIIDVTSYFTSLTNENGSVLDVNRITGDILGYVEKSNVSRLAIDPVAPLIFNDTLKSEITEYIRSLIFSIESNSDCTTLLTSYSPIGSNAVSTHGIEEFAASGIISLKLSKLEQKRIRTIGVRKMRGTRIDLTDYSFEILPNRGIVLRQPV